jgi:hypothetical protein
MQHPVGGPLIRLSCLVRVFFGRIHGFLMRPPEAKTLTIWHGGGILIGGQSLWCPSYVDGPLLARFGGGLIRSLAFICPACCRART